MQVQVLTVSSKGQIALPVNIRKSLNLTSGSKLAMTSYDGAILLKPISLPSNEELKAMLDRAQQYAKEMGYTPEDVDRLIKEYRSSNK